ncbi:hypothetical protein G6F59_014815 [Rhizopus arrhizus]|nr:hypothetical protein G6F59_014815 [Rhizopus arrhizus]
MPAAPAAMPAAGPATASNSPADSSPTLQQHCQIARAGPAAHRGHFAGIHAWPIGALGQQAAPCVRQRVLRIHALPPCVVAQRFTARVCLARGTTQQACDRRQFRRRVGAARQLPVELLQPALPTAATLPPQECENQQQQ